MRHQVLTSLPVHLYQDLVVTFAEQLREPPRRGQEVEFDGVIFWLNRKACRDIIARQRLKQREGSRANGHREQARR